MCLLVQKIGVSPRTLPLTILLESRVNSLSCVDVDGDAGDTIKKTCIITDVFIWGEWGRMRGD